LVDGVREIAAAVAGGVQLVEVFVCKALCNSQSCGQLLTRLVQLDTRLWDVTPEVFERLRFGDRQEGVVAVARTPQRALNTLQVPDGGLVAVICGLEKPGNVGAILRSADAAGVAAVIVTQARTDLFNPNVIRASLGTVFTQQVCETTTPQALAWLRERACKVFAARLDAACSYTEVDYHGNVAIVLGSEATGLSDVWQSAGVTPIRLPMHGAADSLNVSAAAAVLFYEALRQRR
jgi:TrmH family RNA methyltransferase